MDDDFSNAEIGALYTYAAAVNGTPYTTVSVQGICPTGWHMPGEDEWLQLALYLAKNGYYYHGSIYRK